MMTKEDIKRHIVVCDGGDTVDDAIHPDSSNPNVHLLCLYMMVTYGLLIRLMILSAYVLSRRVKRHQSFYGSQELKHLIL